MKPHIELVVEDSEGARIAAQEGADSIELCANLDQGGLTPCAALMAETCRIVAETRPQTRVHILILNKPDGFYPEAADVLALKQGVMDAAQAGAHGVVFGALNAENGLNLPVMRSLCKAAGGMDKTCHRAFDRIPDQDEALEQLIALGFTRVLTSGRPGKAAEHVNVIAHLVERAGSRLTIVAGGGVRAHNLAALGGQTGAPILHMSCRQAEADETGLKRTDLQGVRTVIALCGQLG